MMVKLKEKTVVGVTLTSPTRTDIQVPDVLMFVMIHGNVVINMIPLHAVQAGLVIIRLKNAPWVTLEKVLVVNLAACTPANKIQIRTHIDATPPPILAMYVSQVTLVVTKTGMLYAEAALTHFPISPSDATEPIQIIPSVSHVTIRI